MKIHKISQERMIMMKVKDIDTYGFVVRGIPRMYCEETGELYPLPHDCELSVETATKDSAG